MTRSSVTVGRNIKKQTIIHCGGEFWVVEQYNGHYRPRSIGTPRIWFDSHDRCQDACTELNFAQAEALRSGDYSQLHELLENVCA